MKPGRIAMGAVRSRESDQAPRSHRAKALSSSKRTLNRSQAVGDGRRAAVFFILGVIGAVATFNLVFYVWFAHTDAFRSYLHVTARLSADLLALLGTETMVDGAVIRSTLFSLDVKIGCDAVQPAALLATVVLASPVQATIAARLGAAAAGISFLMLLNLARIVSLFYVGVYTPNLFESVHVEIWQPVFVLAPLAIWLCWLRRTWRRTTRIIER